MKTFIPLENNPSVMTPLAHTLGLSPSLSFHDIYSLHDASLLSLIPRPVHALLVTTPITPTWAAIRTTEDSTRELYNSTSTSEPVIWFKQTIGHACGLIGLIHTCININTTTTTTTTATAAADDRSTHVLPGSELHRLLTLAPHLLTLPRAKLLEDSTVLETAHGAAAVTGDTAAPDADAADRLGNNFIAFVRGRDGHMWELDGSRKGPIDRGVLGDGEDLLSAAAVEAGIGRYMELEKNAGGGVLRFSALALAPSVEE